MTTKTPLYDSPICAMTTPTKKAAAARAIPASRKRAKEQAEDGDYDALRSKVEAQAKALKEQVAKLAAMEHQRNDLEHNKALGDVTDKMANHLTQFLRGNVFVHEHAVSVKPTMVEAPLQHANGVTFQDDYHGGYWACSLLTFQFQLTVYAQKDGVAQSVVGNISLLDGPGHASSYEDKQNDDHGIQVWFGSDVTKYDDSTAAATMCRSHPPLTCGKTTFGKDACSISKSIINLLVHSPRARFELIELVWAMATHPRVADDGKDWPKINRVRELWPNRANYHGEPTPVITNLFVGRKATIGRLQRLWGCTGSLVDCRDE